MDLIKTQYALKSSKNGKWLSCLSAGTHDGQFTYATYSALNCYAYLNKDIADNIALQLNATVHVVNN